MGASVSWFAARGGNAERVLPLIGARGTGEFEDLPESPLVAAQCPGGWFVVYANHFRFIERVPLGRHSADAEVVACGVEEHVMISWAMGWRAGRREWLVYHEAERGVRHLYADGNPPPAFEAIPQRQVARQGGTAKADVDYVFDVPVELARELTGFRYDQQVEGGEFKGFERLVDGGDQ